MNRSVAHGVRASLVLALAVAAGCRPRGPYGTNDGDTVRTARTGPVPTGRHHGALTKPLATYTVGEFQQISAGVAWVGITRNRHCDGPFVCFFSSFISTPVALQAIDDAHLVRFSTLPQDTPSGVILGRMINVGKYAERRYALPNVNARDTTYIVAVPEGNTAYLYLVDVYPASPTTIVRPPRRLQQAFQPCQPPDSIPPPRPFADFTGCSKHYVRVRAAMLGLALESTNTDAAWLTCYEGCCASN